VRFRIARVATDAGEFKPGLREPEQALPLGAIRQDSFPQRFFRTVLGIEAPIHDAQRHSLIR